MRRAFTKVLSRTTSLFTTLSLSLVIAMSSCATADDIDSDDDTRTNTSYDLGVKSFYVALDDDSVISATIDNAARTIKIPGVSSGNDIVRIGFETYTQSTFTPSFDDKISENYTWEDEFEVTLTDDSTNESASYTITLTETSRESGNVLIVDPTETRQQVIYIGADMERCQKSFIYCNNKQEVAEWLFKDIDFNIIRVSYDKQQELEEGVKNFEFYDSCVEAMTYIRATNPNVKFWATLKSDYEGYGSDNNLPDWICDYRNEDGSKNSNYTFNTDKYAIFLSEYCEYFHNKGFTIEYMSTGKEWSGIINYTRAKAVISKMRTTLTEKGVPIPKFSDPSTYGISAGTGWINSVRTGNSSTDYWGFCTHNYPGGEDRTYKFDGMTAAAETLKATGAKNSEGENEFWLIYSESGGATMGSGSGVDIASDMRNGMLDAYREKCYLFEQGFHGELMFEVFSEGASGSRAIYFNKNWTDGQHAYRMSNYYAMQSHGNFFQDGMYYIEAERRNLQSDIYTMSFANEDQMYVAVINLGDAPVDSFIIYLNDKEYNGSVHQHVMDEQTVKVKEQIEGYHISDRNLVQGYIEVSIPAVSGNFFKIDLTKSAVSEDDELAFDWLGASDTSLETEDFADGGSAWQ